MALSAEALMTGFEGPLTRLQKILMTTDGTVTHILEAWSGERIRVEKLEHTEVMATIDDPVLGMSGPEMVIRRIILLQGAVSGQNYLYADSVMLPDRFDAGLAERLRSTDEPVGRLMVEARLETFREVLHCGQEPAGACAVHFCVDPASPLLVRTYLVILHSRPVMRITEKFPAHAWMDG